MNMSENRCEILEKLIVDSYSNKQKFMYINKVSRILVVCEFQLSDLYALPILCSSDFSLNLIS